MRKIIIIFFILFLTFLCLEIILNVCYGIPSREDDPPGFKYLYVDIYEKFFEKVTKNYKSVYSPQRVQSVARDFPVVKAENTVRIFVVGASVVEIWGRCSDLQRALEEQVSNRNFEIINCGIGGYDSYRVYLVTKEIVLYEPDLIIVMSSGNNEYYDKTRFNAKAYYLNKFLRKSLVYRNVQDNILEWADEIGLKNLREKEKRLIDYGNNIKNIVKLAKKDNIPILLSTLPMNVKDSPPNGDAPLNKDFILAHFLLENKKYVQAIDRFKIFLKKNPNSAFGYYFLGRAYLNIKGYEKAKSNFLKALDLDFGQNPQACPSSNKIIRSIGIENKIGVVDLETSFANLASNGISGREQIYDYCHWYDEYYSLVTENVMNELQLNNQIYSSVIDLKDKALKKYPLLYKNFLFSELGKDKEFTRGRTLDSIVDVMMFNGELSERSISYFENIYIIDPYSLWDIQFKKNQIVKMLLDDIAVNEFTNEILKSNTFKDKWASVLYHIGETYRRKGLFNEAIAYFNQSIKFSDKKSWPFIGLALTYDRLNNKQEVLKNIKLADDLFKNSLKVKYYKEIMGI